MCCGTRRDWDAWAHNFSPYTNINVLFPLILLANLFARCPIMVEAGADSSLFGMTT